MYYNVISCTTKRTQREDWKECIGRKRKTRTNGISVQRRPIYSWRRITNSI